MRGILVISLIHPHARNAESSHVVHDLNTRSQRMRRGEIIAQEVKVPTEVLIEAIWLPTKVQEVLAHAPPEVSEVPTEILIEAI